MLTTASPSVFRTHSCPPRQEPSGSAFSIWSASPTLDASGWTEHATLEGGAGADTLKGGNLDNILDGGDGNNSLVGGQNRPNVTAGSDAGVFNWFTAGYGNTTITGGGQHNMLFEG